MDLVNIYLDECGFTGEDLFNLDQPIFTLASIALPEEVCLTLRDKYFSSNKADELKHSNLARRPRQQAAIINLIRDPELSYPNSVKYVVAHKRFVLTAKIVDILIESLANEDGIDLYKNGVNTAFSNMFFYFVRDLLSEEFF